MVEVVVEVVVVVEVEVELEVVVVVEVEVGVGVVVEVVVVVGSSSMSIFEELAKPFNPKAVSWRKGGGNKYLAYIDARDVMQRLDDVVGPENWQDTFRETSSGRVLAQLHIRIGDDWIIKTDGAGDTKVEGEKGAISDAFKRAAVKWGVGRYLYDLPTVDSPQEGYEILLSRYNVMPEEQATVLFNLLDEVDIESGDGVLAWGEAWLELNPDEQMGLSPWISKMYPGGVSKIKEKMRDTLAAYRQIHG